MQCTPHDLKEKLLKGLDEENNVVDMAAVVAVITILEKYPMSREALEQTRIGRYVNELRKKTKDEQLAKRAKKLVKTWHQLINSDNPIVNGDHGERPVHPSIANIQNNSPRMGSLSPALQGAKSSQVKRLPNTPTLQQRQKINTPGLKSKPNTPNMPPIVSPGLRSTHASSPQLHSTPKFSISPKVAFSNDSQSPALSPVSGGSRSSTPIDTPVRPPSSECRLTRNKSYESISSTCSDNLHNSNKNHSPELNGKTNNRNCDEKLSKTDVANRKRARLDYSGEIQSKLAKTDNCVEHSKLNGAVKSSSSSNTQKTNGSLSKSPSENSLKSFSSRKNVNLSLNTDKTPKVKTTAQIIAELQAKSGSSAVGSSVIKQIETNQIQKESDVPESVLPPGARPRRNKKRNLGQSILDMSASDPSHSNLSQTKSEMVEKFLQSSVTPSTAGDMSPFKCDDPSESRGETSSEVVDSSGGDIVCRSDEVKSREQESSKFPTLEEIMQGLPPINHDDIVEDINYEIPDYNVVSDELVDRLHNDDWSNVNGNTDSGGQWHNWTQMFTNISYSDEPLHILPYVLIDD